MRHRDGVLSCALAAGVVASLAVSAFGQVAGPTWVALDTQPAGTPPSVVIDRANSNEDQSVFTITIHGFWSQPVNLPGVGNFTRIWSELNENTTKLMVPGRPELPVESLMLAIPTNAAQLSMPQVTLLNSTTLNNIDVFPSQSDFLEEEGVPPVAPPPAYDAAFYGQNTVFPASVAELPEPPETLLGVRMQEARINLFRANPGQRSLLVTRQVRVTVGHNGTASPGVEVTRRTSRALASVLDNIVAVLSTYIIPNDSSYKGEYLIIVPSDWVDEIFPLAQQKSERGYRVTIRTVESVGSTSGEIWGEINDWQAAAPSGSDAYVLLVGDTDRIQLGFSPRHGANVSDYGYACNPLNSTSSPDRFVGRFSVETAAEVTRLVNRTIGYMDNPISSSRWDNVLLAAHNQVENGYVNCVNEIAESNVYFGATPQFTRRRGTLSDGTVANVLSDIAAGQGVILYRGHGGSTSWSDWDFNDASLTADQVQSMTMNLFVRPIVFSVACANSRIDRSDAQAISEVWHRRSNGAVAHVGGSRNTWTSANHTYAKSNIFWIYFPSFAPQMGLVNTLAGAVMATNHSGCGWDNRFLYLLQGDPEMMVWRENPATTSGLTAERGGLPEVLAPGLHGISYTYLTSGGTPIDDAIVSLYKEDDVRVNRYTDDAGEASFLVSVDSCGELVLRAYSDFENVEGQRHVIHIAILGDANRDRVVNFADITNVLENWGVGYTTPVGPGDADFSRTVNFADITAVLRGFGDSCE